MQGQRDKEQQPYACTQWTQHGTVSVLRQAPVTDSTTNGQTVRWRTWLVAEADV